VGRLGSPHALLFQVADDVGHLLALGDADRYQGR
jgi:hypothetical protein